MLMKTIAIIYSLTLNFLLLYPLCSFAQEACFECHNDPELVTEDVEGNEILLHLEPEVYSRSIHGEFDCTDCHASIDLDDHPGEKSEYVDCGTCHEDVAKAHLSSVHGQSGNGSDAASCADCHGKHDILPIADLASRVSPLNLATTCAICHSNPKITQKYNIPISDPLAAYKNSIHGVAILTEQNFDAATCGSCHGFHNIKAMDDPESLIHWQNVAKTCGRCHGEIYEQYTESVHGRAVEKGIRAAPVCTNCHGEHNVKSHTDPDSPVHPLRVSAVTCERCHASEQIVGRFGLSMDRKETFEESYHGLAIKGGSLSAANCASCHGIHNILPSSAPASLVYPANLKKTCGKCHPDISENVAKGAVHLTTSSAPGRIVHYVEKFYILLIVVVIGVMVIHNSADFVKRAKRRIKMREEE